MHKTRWPLWSLEFSQGERERHWTNKETHVSAQFMTRFKKEMNRVKEVNGMGRHTFGLELTSVRENISETVTLT